MPNASQGRSAKATKITCPKDQEIKSDQLVGAKTTTADPAKLKPPAVPF